MTMQLLKVCLYGNENERRVVRFNLGKLNIITGKSKTGKSSLLEIVEYCLGSSECNVAEGLISQTVSWYSIVLQFKDTQVFIARAAPLQGKKSNTACYMFINHEILLPEYKDIKQTTNISSVQKYLTTKIGIPEFITEVPEDQTRDPINIKFKHSLFYLFQSQDEVASKKTLFHRQAEPYIPQSIIDTLPYFLGAADDDRLSEIEKLRALKRERTRISKSIREIENLKGEGLKNGEKIVREASSVGLYKGSLTLNDLQVIQSLKEISRWVPSKSYDDREDDNNSLYELDNHYSELSQKKKILENKIQATKRYYGTLNQFTNELNEQDLRLRSIGLFKELEANGQCAICEKPHSDQSSLDFIIKTSISELNERLNGIFRNKPRVQSYLIGLNDQKEKLAAELKITRISMEKIRENETNLLVKADLDNMRARVSGKASLYLESVDWNIDISDKKIHLEHIENQISALSLKLDPETLKSKMESQLSLISRDMTKWAKELKLEHSENPIRLDVNQLTVAAETYHGRTPLYRMGSGENWVGYHLVTYVALAKWFIEKSRPVGNFIFFDQPSQVYFPADISTTGTLDEIPEDEDRTAVKELFHWLYKTVSLLSPDLQVIVTDHADIDEEWFQSSIVDEKWRGDRALIPNHWNKK